VLALARAWRFESSSGHHYRSQMGSLPSGLGLLGLAALLQGVVFGVVVFGICSLDCGPLFAFDRLAKTQLMSPSRSGGGENQRKGPRSAYRTCPNHPVSIVPMARQRSDIATSTVERSH
jgi:hypothetical protein